jgi:putative transposase
VYLTAIIDWYSRYVLDWEVSVTMDTGFCSATLSRKLMQATPEIFNTDQGSQYTAKPFIDLLKAHPIRISVDGRGRALDNVFVERLWRSVKPEEVYLNDSRNVSEAKDRLSAYFYWYNQERLHKALDYIDLYRSGHLGSRGYVRLTESQNLKTGPLMTRPEFLSMKRTDPFMIFSLLMNTPYPPPYFTRFSVLIKESTSGGSYLS